MHNNSVNNIDLPRKVAGWVSRSLSAAVSVFIASAFLLVQMHAVMAAIDNTAVAVGSYGGNPVVSNASSQSIPVVAADPRIGVNKTGVLNDDDGTLGLSAGDTITYTVQVSNPGNISLTGVSVSDPLVTLSFQSGDTDADGSLDPGEVWIYTGNYTITVGDLTSNGGGDGDIDNIVTATSNEAGPVIATEETTIDPNVSMVVSKNGTLNDNDGTPGLSAGDTVDYQITIINTGVTDLTNVTVTDTLVQSGISTNLTPTFASGDLNGDSRVNSGETWVYTVSYTVTQANIDDGGFLVNTASVTTDEIGPRDADDLRPLPGITESYTMTKSAALADTDGDLLADAGEVITYTFSFTNTGNRTLANLLINDPLPGLSAISCASDLDSDGDIDLLSPGQTLDCTATYTVQPTDISTGSVTNTATSAATRTNGIVPVSEDDSANDNSTTTFTDSNFDLEVTKEVVSATEILPNIVQIDYLVSIINPTVVTQSNVRLQDDLAAALSAPAVVVGDATITSVSGFTGTGGANPTFDGTSDVELLVGDVQLAGSATGQVGIRVLVDRRGESLNSLNVAIASSDQVPGSVPSDDPNETPGDTTDTNPTPFSSPDVDGDGAPDSNESPTGDRDGDGIADANDYDPTGYFYCEADGRILTGGFIAVQNLTAGGIQSGIGSSNDITILQDGSNGFYQFYVSAPGTYRLITTLPAGGTASTANTPLPPLDVTSLLPSNPAVLGSGEVGSTGVLADFTSAANPFHTEFVIEAGDPTIFNNNIPLTLCGTPSLLADKTIASGPIPQADGTSNISFEITVENDGSERVENVGVTEDLDAAFGLGNYTLISSSLLPPPAGFTANANPFFDGSANTELLTTGGELQPGESITLVVDVNVDLPPATYTNSISASGENPLDGSPITPGTASTPIVLTGAGATDGVVVTKSTPFDSAPIGATIPYTISFENTSSLPVVAADLVDQLPAGFSYVPNSAEVNGVPTEPVTNTPELIWPNQNISPGSSTTIRLLVVLGAGTVGTEFTNYAYARNPADGSLISNRAQATIRLEIESAFQCSHIIGRVFDDLDKDGYYDVGEPGLGGVRVVSVNGLLITTDEFGRYHVTCDAIPDDRIGSNYILKLDDRTLPTGYRITSENPRVVRLTRGKLSKINFATANLRKITLSVDAESFRGNSTSLTPGAIRDIARILPILEEERSILVLKYNDRDALKENREKAVRALVSKAWKSKKRPYKLVIESDAQQR